MRILFFTESLVCGGKERRLLELIQYLKNNTEHVITLVITEPEIHYEYAYDIGIPIIIMKRKGLKYDPLLFLTFFRYCIKFKPDVIHAWGRMTTFYAIPSKVFLGVPLITSMIADAKRGYPAFSIRNLFFNIDVFMSDVILSNSKAGIVAHNVKSKRAKPILNGVRLERFQKEFDIKKERENLGVNTGFMVVNVASFSRQKDYDLFLDTAKEFQKIRDDVTFVAVGDGPLLEHIRKRMIDELVTNVILAGNRKEVENIVAASDIGLLCTRSEGISNAVIEYMALGKPVVSTDIVGGSREIIVEGETGYCVARDVTKVVPLINSLLDSPELRLSMGTKGRQRIFEHFSLDRMGQEFDLVYKNIFKMKKVEVTNRLKN